ncbi:MAG: haloacid dehalogenase-like hydrolase [Patescibacteria group bacterium]
MRTVAIFDIDGTIFRSSLLIELVSALVAEGIFPRSAAAEFAREKLAWLDRKGDYEDYVAGVVEAFLRHIKGVEYKDFARVAEEVVAEQKDRVYRYTRDLIRKLKRRGYYLLAISHSPKSILDHFCKRAGFNKVYGMVFELGPMTVLPEW